MIKKKSKIDIKKNDKNNDVECNRIESNYVYNSLHDIKILAKFFKITNAKLIKTLLNLGIKKNINDFVDKKTVKLLCKEFNVKFVDNKIKLVKNVNHNKVIDAVKKVKLQKRPPIVTIMGHVNHGKTTLLDTIRRTRVVDKEFGGITQHIGAYQVQYQSNSITFIDTPGHEIFNQTRKRGAQITDICVLLLAVDDGIKPQTLESLKYAQVAKVPIIVVLNKIDKFANFNKEKIMSELSHFDLLPEIWGGSTQYVEISALKNQGIDNLLEIILLISEMQNYQTEMNVFAEGCVIESNLDKSQGPIATFLIKKGILKIGDIVVVGNTYGKIRSIENDLKIKLQKALPSQPVKVSGLKAVANVGDIFFTVKDEVTAKNYIDKIKTKKIDHLDKDNKIVLLENFLSNVETNDVKYLNIILKTDYQGSADTIKSVLEKINFKDIKIRFIKISVGDISESDINLGELNSSFIIGFNVNANRFVRNLSKMKGIKINIYNIIYRMTEDIEKIMKNLLDKSVPEVILGQAEVRKIFTINKIGTIAGCYVIDGCVTNNDLVKIVRHKEIITKSKIVSLKRLKDNILNSKKGQECGILVENFNNFEINDIIQSYKLIKKAEH